MDYLANCALDVSHATGQRHTRELSNFGGKHHNSRVGRGWPSYRTIRKGILTALHLRNPLK